MKILVLVLLFVVGIAEAQDAAPWPPDPADIFAPGVEVVSAKESYYPRVIADDESRIVKIYDIDAGEWQEFPYPQEATVLSGRIDEHSDGTIVFNEPYSDLDSPPEDWPEAWLLNPTNGEFSHPEIVCDWRIRAQPGRGEWVFHGQNGRTYLCFTETGELSSPLPNGVGWIDDPVLGSPPELSPDGRWVALMGFEDSETNIYGTFSIYSYQVSTDQLRYLGEFGGDSFQQYQGFRGWVSETKGIIYQSGPETFGTDAYVFDAAQADSLRIFLEGRWPRQYENPPRHEYLETERFLEFKLGSEVRPRPCIFNVYDALGADTFEVGNDCGEIQRVPNGYVYLNFPYDYPTPTSTLNYLDRQTGNQAGLFSGEIEALDSVSPDGRYAVVLMDRNGQIDTNEYYPEPFDWGTIPYAYLAIVDTQPESNNRIIYETESLVGPQNYNININVREYRWLGDRTLLMLIGCGGDNLCVRLVQWDRGSYTVNAVGNVDYPVVLSPDQQTMLTTHFDDVINEEMLVAVRFSDNRIIPIAQKSLLKADYYEWLDDDLLSIRLSNENNTYERGEYITYVLRVPQFES